MGPIGIQEMIGIFVIALLLFGPKKLPELGRTLGKALSEFRRAKNELKNTFETHLQELERETRMDANTPKIAAPSYTPPSYTPPSYSYPYEDGSTYGATSNPYAEPNPPAAIEPASTPAPLPAATPVQGAVARSNGATPVTSHAAPSENPPASSTVNG